MGVQVSPGQPVMLPLGLKGMAAEFWPRCVWVRILRGHPMEVRSGGVSVCVLKTQGTRDGIEFESTLLPPFIKGNYV
jgi:hypothetical protein